MKIRVPKSGAKEPEWRFGLRFHKGGAKKEPQFWHFSLTKTQIVAVFNSKHLGTLTETIEELPGQQRTVVSGPIADWPKISAAWRARPFCIL